jgi:hypothetical protein
MHSSATQPLKQKARVRKLIIRNNLCRDPWGGGIVCYVEFSRKGKPFFQPYGGFYVY